MEVIKISVDFGLVVLIWIVQLIIYPGFVYYDEKKFLDWHKRYTLLISAIVAPLMIGQASFHIYDLIYQTDLIGYISIGLILGCWLLTFGWAMPLHNRIDQGESVTLYVHKLIQMNKYRTFGWTTVLALSIVHYLN